MSGFAEVLAQAAREAGERIASCHERVACPRCKAPVGHRCINLRTGSLTKHPHDQRWQLETPAR